jgi:spore coat polysaccharide biosynthesis protein SpsF (cytidylyltransferase family)
MRTGLVIEATIDMPPAPTGALSQLAGRPLLNYLVERVQASAQVNDLVICTRDAAEDDRIDAFGNFFGLAVYRSAVADDGRQLAAIAAQRGWNAVGRLTPTQTFVDPALLDHAIKLLRLTGADAVTNTLAQTYPPGQEVSFITRRAFHDALAEHDPAATTSFVTVLRHIYANPHWYRGRPFAAVRSFDQLDLAVHDHRDLARLSALLDDLPQPHWHVGLDEFAQAARDRGLAGATGV